MNLRNANRLSKQKVLSGIIRIVLFLYLLCYLVLFAGYFFFVGIVHSSFSIISVPATLLPYLLLLSILWGYWKIGATQEKRDDVGKDTLKRIRMVALAGLIPVILLLSVLGKNELDSTFDASRWQKQHDVRVYMVDDLLEHHQLQGMSRKEVLQLLGQPEDTAYFKQQNNIVYWLGPERGLVRIDSEWLVIWFNRDDHVTSVKVTRD